MVINDYLNVNISSPALELTALVIMKPSFIPRGYNLHFVLNVLIFRTGSNSSFVVVIEGSNGKLNLH